MSRYGIYRVRIDVFGYDPQKCGDIARVISYSWKNVHMLELCENNVSSLRFDGEGYLSMGETEHEFCEKISERIDIVNGAPCKVKIKMLYLDTAVFNKCKSHAVLVFGSKPVGSMKELSFIPRRCAMAFISAIKES